MTLGPEYDEWLGSVMLQCLRMEARVASLVNLLLATLGFSWTFFRAKAEILKIWKREVSM